MIEIKVSKPNYPFSVHYVVRDYGRDSTLNKTYIKVSEAGRIAIFERSHGVHFFEKRPISDNNSRRLFLKEKVNIEKVDRGI